MGKVIEWAAAAVIVVVALIVPAIDVAVRIVFFVLVGLLLVLRAIRLMRARTGSTHPGPRSR